MKTVALSGFVGSDFTGPSVRAALVAARGEAVRFELSSPGGFVDAGLEVASLIRNYKGPTTIHIMGIAASMGSFIACAAQRVTAEPSSVYMVHLPSMGAAGTEDDFRRSAEVLTKYGDALALEYARKSRKSLAEVRELMRAETFYGAEDAKAAGFIDEVVGVATSTGSTARGRTAAIEAARAQCRAVQARIGSRPGDVARIAALLRPVHSDAYTKEAAAVLASLSPEDLASLRKAGMTDEDIARFAPTPNGRCLAEIAAESGKHRHAPTGAKE